MRISSSVLFMTCWSLARGQEPCMPPDTPTNGDVVESEEDGTQVIKFSCYPGYSLNGLTRLTCEGGQWTGPVPACVATDCLTHFMSGENVTGVYTIQPSSDLTPVEVTCDMATAGGGWTVIQRRMDNSTDFNRTYSDYQRGFGKASGNFWLGLDYIHAITESNVAEMYIHLEQVVPGVFGIAQYRYTHVAGKDQGYLLTLGGFHGTVTDSMDVHSGARFSAPDVDQDEGGGHCARNWASGWWFTNCFNVNLNGQYAAGPVPFAHGIIWEHYTGDYYSLPRVHMMVRPVLTWGGFHFLFKDNADLESKCDDTIIGVRVENCSRIDEDYPQDNMPTKKTSCLPAYVIVLIVLFVAIAVALLILAAILFIRRRPHVVGVFQRFGNNGEDNSKVTISGLANPHVTPSADSSPQVRALDEGHRNDTQS